MGKMAQTKVKLGERLNCLRCKHEWLPRQELVVICPKCKSPYWNIPRTMIRRKAKPIKELRKEFEE